MAACATFLKLGDAVSNVALQLSVDFRFKIANTVVIVVSHGIYVLVFVLVATVKMEKDDGSASASGVDIVPGLHCGNLSQISWLSTLLTTLCT